jgi:Retrotransposon gag protein
VHRTVVDEDEEMGDFEEVEEGEDGEGGVTKSGKACLPKYVPPQPFDGTWDDTKSFISSVALYISGRHPEFRTAKSKIMFTLSYIKGGKAQFWRNEAINEIVAGHKPFKNFHDFLAKLEAQFGNPNPDATAKGKLKVMHQGAKTVDEFILEFKSEASRSNLGDVVLIKYLRVGLNQSLFKSIY